VAEATGEIAEIASDAKKALFTVSSGLANATSQVADAVKGAVGGVGSSERDQEELLRKAKGTVGVLDSASKKELCLELLKLEYGDATAEAFAAGLLSPSSEPGSRKNSATL